jgi:hypothetical protein
MARENPYEGVEHVVYVSTGDKVRCEHCDQMVGGTGFADSVNHYIAEHGYKLFHVGAETSRDSDGNPWHMTVAVLGK